MGWSELLQQTREPVPAGPIPDGRRDESLTRIAGAQRRHGASEAAILAALRIENRERCQPPLPDADVRKIARSVARYAPEPESMQLLTRNGSNGAHAEGPPADRGLRFYGPRELAGLTLEVPDWLVRGILAVQSITEIDGKIKAAGKTTFLLAMVRALLDGQPFLGQPTRRCTVIYITEQQRQPFMDALRRAGLADRDESQLAILFREQLGGQKWPGIVRAIQAKASAEGRSLIVVDTIGKLAGIVEENDAGTWSAAMAPLQDLAASNVAVAIGRHDRKSGGEVGESGRGSSQASGDVDIILALRRPEGNQPSNRRVIESLSRYPDTPEKVVVELTADGYNLLGDSEAVATSDARLVLLSALGSEFRQHDSGASQADLVELGAACLPKVRRWAILEALEALVAEGRVKVTGKAHSRTNPLRYWPSSGVVETQTSGVPTTHFEGGQDLTPPGHPCDGCGVQFLTAETLASHQKLGQCPAQAGQLMARILQTTGGEEVVA